MLDPQVSDLFNPEVLTKSIIYLTSNFRLLRNSEINQIKIWVLKYGVGLTWLSLIRVTYLMP